MSPGAVELLGLAHEIAGRIEAETGLPPEEATIEWAADAVGRIPVKLTWHLDYRGDGLGVTNVAAKLLGSTNYQGMGSPEDEWQVGPVRVDHCEQEYRWVGSVHTDLVLCKAFVHRDLDEEDADYE